MSDAKYFQRGKIQELRAELNSDKKDAKHTKKKVVMKKIVANMTMGNDMSSLFPDVIACMQVPVLEVKKMVYLYLINYARNKPDMALMAVNSFVKDVADPNPLIRALAIRTMGYIHVEKIIDCLCEPLRHCLRDQDPYVRKTAAICVAKLYMHDRTLVESEGFIDMLRELLADSNPTVVANAVAALTEISERSGDIELNLNMTIASKLLTAMAECSEWGQTFILEAIMTIVPQEAGDAEMLAERITPRLQHANSAVVLTSIKVIMYLMNYMKDEAIPPLCKKLSPPLVTLLSSGPEVQYVALRNILLIIQKRSDVLSNEMKVFFCKYNDVIYVKLVKLEIMFRLANESNVDQVISELKEYAAEVDVDFVRKSVRCIGRLAVKIERTAERCIAALLDLIQTKVDYVVQEAIVVIKDIFRKYPNKYENIIGTLCENLDNLDEPEAKAAMIWIIGQYADRIENSDELLEGFLESFKEEGAEVQLALLTATVKLFIKRPTAGQELVPKVLKWATEETDNPDLRDRGYIYWRLLSTDPQAAKAIVLCEKPLISTEADNMERSLLDGLLLHISSIASIYHKPPTSFLVGSKVRTLKSSAALNSQASTKPQAGTEKNDPSIYDNPYINNPYANDVVPMNATQAVNLLDLDFGGESAIEAVRSTGAFGGETFGSGMQEQHFLPPAGIFGADPMTANNPFGRNLDMEREGSYSPGANSAFGGPPPYQGNSGGSFSPTRPFASPGAGSSPLQGSNLNPSSLYDPMRQMNLGGSAPGAGMTAKVGDLYDLNIAPGFVPSKHLFLSAANGKGLEIMGTFARRQGRMTMEMSFTNKAMQPLSDFAIQLNKNTYAVCPAGPLELRSPLPPNQTAEGILQLKCEGLPQLMQPVNNLQVALKNNVGVFYFQTLIPLHVLFSEDGRLERNEYLRLWKEIPTTNEQSAEITVSHGCTSVDMLKNKLNMNNVFAVADRQVDNYTLLYLSAKLMDRTAYLVELKTNSTLTVCQAAVKTYATHGSAAFLQTISDILCS